MCVWPTHTHRPVCVWEIEVWIIFIYDLQNVVCVFHTHTHKACVCVGNWNLNYFKNLARLCHLRGWCWKCERLGSTDVHGNCSAKSTHRSSHLFRDAIALGTGLLNLRLCMGVNRRSDIPNLATTTQVIKRIIVILVFYSFHNGYRHTFTFTL